MRKPSQGLKSLQKRKDAEHSAKSASVSVSLQAKRRGRKPLVVDAGKPSVRDRILEVAERLFADHGMSGVGMRAISSEAQVNLASIAYHFGSKEGLLAALFAHRAAPIADARMRLLDEAEAKHGGPPPLEAVIEAFVRPALIIGPQSPASGEAFRRLRARLATEPEKLSRRILSQAFDKSSGRFIEALVKALPGLPRAQVEWRFHFMLGAMFYTMANSGRIQVLTNQRCDPGDAELALKHMVPFLAAGFRSAPL